MNVTLPRGAIKEAVAGLSKIVYGKQTIPVLGCVRLSVENQTAVAEATDLDQVVKYRFDDAQAHGEGACILPLVALKDLTKGGKDERVEIDANDPLRISVTNHVGGHAVAQTLTGMDLDEWPADCRDVPTQPAEGFLETFRRLVPFSSTDETRYVLNSVFVEVGKGETPVTMAATDGRRLACFNSMTLPLKKSVVIPTTRFLAGAKLPDNVEVGVRDDDGLTWLGVTGGAFKYAVKCVDVTYPNYRQVIPAEPGASVIVFADSDVALLKQVLMTLPGDDDITVVGSDRKVTLYGRATEEERWATLMLEETSYCGERRFVGLNRRFLLDALAAGFRDFAITDELSPVLSRDSEGGTHVLMPMRVEDPVVGDEVAEVLVSPVKTESGTQTWTSDAAQAPEPQAASKKRQGRRKDVTNQKEQATETPALDRMQVACDEARIKVKEAGQALTELSKAIRDVSREQKSQEKEVEAAKAAIAKV